MLPRTKSHSRLSNPGRAHVVLVRIPHIGSLQAQWAIQTRWWHHIRVLQGQSIAGLSNKGCDSRREPCFLSVFVVFGPLPMG